MLFPMSEMDQNVTELLEAVRDGEDQASDRLVELVYGELRRLARVRIAAERSEQAPQPTSLVHEAYLRLLGGEQKDWKNRRYFFSAAAEAMRRVLVDGARKRNAQKRGGDAQQVTLADTPARHEADPTDVLAIDQALTRLEQQDARMADVAKLRYFAEMSIEEIATATESSPRTVNRLWSAARAWLQREMRRS